MSAPLMGLVAAIYVWVAMEHLLAGRHGLCLAFIAYAVSNIGFMIDLARRP